MGDTKTDDSKAAETNANQNGEEPAPPTPKEMRAIVLTGFGGLKTVKVMKKPEPAAPGEGEVLIRVKACGLNFLDLMARQGAIDNPPKTPCVMGFECAGVVEAIGEGVTEFKIDDSVVALTEYKAWAELVCVPAKYVYSLPSGMEHQEAVSMLMNYIVAYCLVFDIGNLQQGQKVLIHSAGGSVGLAVAALCSTVPDVTLIGTASKHKHDTIAEYFTHLFDHSQDYVQETKKLMPDGVDLVLDCVCGEDVNKGYSLLKPLGRYVLYGTSSIVSGETKSFFSFAKSWWQVDKVSPIKLFDENKILAGFHLRHLLYQQGCHDYIQGVVSKIFKMWEEKKVKVITDSGWAFEDVAEAMQKMHDRKNIGKITLLPDKAPKPQAKAIKEKEKSITSGESTDTEKDAKDEQTPPPWVKVSRNSVSLKDLETERRSGLKQSPGLKSTVWHKGHNKNTKEQNVDKYKDLLGNMMSRHGLKEAPSQTNRSREVHWCIQEGFRTPSKPPLVGHLGLFASA